LGNYIVRRLLGAIPLLLGVSIINFAIMRMTPGGPMAVYANYPNMRAEDLERIEASLGLRDPIHLQYIKWLGGLVSGNWGISYINGRPVIDVIFERVPATITLMGAALLVTVVFGISVGTLSAVRRQSIADHLATIGALIGLSTPTFWLGLMVILLFAVHLRWLPSGGMFTLGEPFSLADRLRHLIAPACVLGVVQVAIWSRYMRSSLLEVIGQDYIRTAHAKGLHNRTVFFRHALRNAILPIITLFGLQIPKLFGGALVTETVFGWPGIGRLYYDSLNNRDYGVLMGILMIIAVLVIVGNLFADIFYGIVDPRIRYE
jgi:peptide/nickel transport system permease protein